jgi:hypothetical protein
MWGRLITCGGLLIRLPLAYEKLSRGRVANPPQVANLPHKEGCKGLKDFNG